jgi:hypothetical protein
MSLEWTRNLLWRILGQSPEVRSQVDEVKTRAFSRDFPGVDQGNSTIGPVGFRFRSRATPADHSRFGPAIRDRASKARVLVPLSDAQKVTRTQLSSSLLHVLQVQQQRAWDGRWQCNASRRLVRRQCGPWIYLAFTGSEDGTRHQSVHKMMVTIMWKST